MQKWIIGLALVVWGGTVAVADVLSVRVSDNPPLIYQNAQGNWTGFDVDLAQALLSKTKYTPNYQIYRWRRGLAQLENGQLDMMLSLSMTEERKELMYFIGPVREEKIVMVVPKQSDIPVSSLDDFKSIRGRVGSNVGGYYGAAFDEKFKTDKAFANKFEGLSVGETHIEKLKSKQIIGFFADYYNIAYKMKHDKNYADVKLHPFLINKDLVYFGFSKKTVTAPMLQQLEFAFKQAQTERKFEKIIKQYERELEGSRVARQSVVQIKGKE